MTSCLSSYGVAEFFITETGLTAADIMSQCLVSAGAHSYQLSACSSPSPAFPRALARLIRTLIPLGYIISCMLDFSSCFCCYLFHMHILRTNNLHLRVPSEHLDYSRQNSCAVEAHASHSKATQEKALVKDL